MDFLTSLFSCSKVPSDLFFPADFPLTNWSPAHETRSLARVARWTDPIQDLILALATLGFSVWSPMRLCFQLVAVAGV
jgi:hypothetical protein